MVPKRLTFEGSFRLVERTDIFKDHLNAKNDKRILCNILESKSSPTY